MYHFQKQRHWNYNERNNLMRCTVCSNSISFSQTRDCIDWEKHFSGSCPLQSKVRKREREWKKYSIPCLAYIHDFATMFGVSLTASSEYKLSLTTFPIFFFFGGEGESKPLHNSVIPLKEKGFENVTFKTQLPSLQAALHLHTAVSIFCSSSSCSTQERGRELFQMQSYNKHEVQPLNSQEEPGKRTLILLWSLISQDWTEGSRTSWRSAQVHINCLVWVFFNYFYFNFLFGIYRAHLPQQWNWLCTS